MKSLFLKVFVDGITDEITIESEVGIVMDGGFLLDSVPWPRKGTYGDIIQNYCTYVINKYGRNSTVVFDGYLSEATTKGEEQARRSGKNSSCNIEFDKTQYVSPKKSLFFQTKTIRKHFDFE